MKKIKLYVCLLLIIASALIPLKVFAVNVDYGFYGANDILFYDPNACSSNSSSGTSGGGAAGTAAQNLEAVLKYFTGKGFSLAVAAGIAGNFVMESGLDPAKIQGGAIASDSYDPINGIDGFGLAQWTDIDRQRGLVAFANSQGKKITDLNMQLDYAWQEMTTGKVEMMERLNSIKSETSIGSASAPMAAAIIFHGITDEIAANPTKEITDVNPPHGFESSGDSAAKVVADRGGSAVDFYNQYKGKIADGTGVVGIGSSTVGASSSGSSGCNPNAAAGATIDQEKLYEASDNIDCAPGTTEAIKSQPVNVGHGSSTVNIKLCYIPDTVDTDSVARTFDSVITVNSRVSGAWLALLNEIRAKTGDTTIYSGSSFRTYDMQLASQGDYFSNHEMGIAIDFQTIYTCVGGAIGSTLSQGSCPYFDLLKSDKLGEKYGFQDRQSPYEAWHWEPKGVKY